MSSTIQKKLLGFNEMSRSSQKGYFANPTPHGGAGLSLKQYSLLGIEGNFQIGIKISFLPTQTLIGVHEVYSKQIFLQDIK